jgi:hypothetical protein
MDEENNKEHLEIRLGVTGLGAMIGSEDHNYFINQVHSDGSYRPIGRTKAVEVKLSRTAKKVLFYEIHTIDFHKATADIIYNLFIKSGFIKYLSGIALTEESADKKAHLAAQKFAKRVETFYESNKIIDRREEDLENIIKGLKDLQGPDAMPKMKFYQK